MEIYTEEEKKIIEARVYGIKQLRRWIVYVIVIKIFLVAVICWTLVSKEGKLMWIIIGLAGAIFYLMAIGIYGLIITIDQYKNHIIRITEYDYLDRKARELSGKIGKLQNKFFLDPKYGEKYEEIKQIGDDAEQLRKEIGCYNNYSWKFAMSLVKRREENENQETEN